MGCRMRIRATFCWVAILIGALQGSSPASLRAQNSQPPGSNSFLGFSPGEVRRYSLGPSDSLLAGELAEWSIGLDSLLSRSSRAIFALEYRWQAPRLVGVEPPIGVITSIESTGELTLDAHGFPVDSQTHTTVTRAGYGTESHSVHYRFRGETLHKSVAVGHDTWSLEISILDHKDLDIEHRRGLLAYNPTIRPDCYDPGRYVAQAPARSPTFPAVARPRSPSISVPAVSRNYDFVCDGRNDMIFANPGLLGFAAPLLAESEGDHEFLFFTPLWPLADLGIRAQASFGTTSTGLGGANVVSSRGFDAIVGDRMEPERGPAAARSAANNFEKTRVRALRPRGLEIDGVLFEATPLEIGGPIRRAWLDPDGRVLRVDLEDSLATGPRFVRLLPPRELQ